MCGISRQISRAFGVICDAVRRELRRNAVIAGLTVTLPVFLVLATSCLGRVTYFLNDGNAPLVILATMDRFEPHAAEEGHDQTHAVSPQRHHTVRHGPSTSTQRIRTMPEQIRLGSYPRQQRQCALAVIPTSWIPMLHGIVRSRWAKPRWCRRVNNIAEAPCIS